MSQYLVSQRFLIIKSVKNWAVLQILSILVNLLLNFNQLPIPNSYIFNFLFLLKKPFPYLLILITLAGDTKTLLKTVSYIDLENNLMVARGEGWRDGIVGEFGMDRCTGPHLKRITNRDPPCSTENSAQCCVAARRGGEFGGEWAHTHTHRCMGGSFCCSPELSQHC